MKLRASQWLWVVLVLAVGIWVFTHLAGGDAGKVRRQLGELDALIEKPKGEKDLVGAGKVHKIGNLLTPQFEIVIEPYSQRVTDRRELLRVAMAYRSREETVAVDWSDQELEIQDDRATLGTVATVTGAGGRRESYRMSFEWARTEGTWLIERIVVLEVLEGLPSFL